MSTASQHTATVTDTCTDTDTNTFADTDTDTDTTFTQINKFLAGKRSRRNLLLSSEKTFTHLNEAKAKEFLVGFPGDWVLGCLAAWLAEFLA